MSRNNSWAPFLRRLDPETFYTRNDILDLCPDLIEADKRVGDEPYMAKERLRKKLDRVVAKMPKVWRMPNSKPGWQYQIQLHYKFWDMHHDRATWEGVIRSWTLAFEQGLEACPDTVPAQHPDDVPLVRSPEPAKAPKPSPLSPVYSPESDEKDITTSPESDEMDEKSAKASSESDERDEKGAKASPESDEIDESRLKISLLSSEPSAQVAQSSEERGTLILITPPATERSQDQAFDGNGWALPWWSLLVPTVLVLLLSLLQFASGERVNAERPSFSDYARSIEVSPKEFVATDREKDFVWSHESFTGLGKGGDYAIYILPPPPSP